MGIYEVRDVLGHENKLTPPTRSGMGMGTTIGEWRPLIVYGLGTGICGHTGLGVFSCHGSKTWVT